VNLLGDNIDTIKKNTQTLIDATKEVGLEVNTEETIYIVTCHLRSQPIERFVAGQQLRRYATGSRPRVTMEVELEEVFSMWSVPRSYLEDTWGELPVVSCQF
jgi:hypothetical protein